jgi:hypothetical protein
MFTVVRVGTESFSRAATVSEVLESKGNCELVSVHNGRTGVKPVKQGDISSETVLVAARSFPVGAILDVGARAVTRSCFLSDHKGHKPHS